MNHDESHGKYMKYIELQYIDLSEVEKNITCWQNLFLVQTFQNNDSPPRLEKRHTKNISKDLGKNADVPKGSPGKKLM